MHAWLVKFHKEFLLEGGREAQEGRDIYTYSRFILLYSRNEHNIVK